MEELQNSGEVFPYTCLNLDATFYDFVSACWKALTIHSSTSLHLHSLIRQLFTDTSGPNYYLPCFSIRTAFHAFLKVTNFPPGSEIIMSAINIPDMVKIAEFHGLKVVPVDISADTLAPKTEIMECLVNEKTVAVLVAHLFGKWHDVEPALEIAQKHNLYFLEDAAQSFFDCQNFGHTDSDLVFLSFGVIKNSTSFGGAVAKVKNKQIFQRMSDILHDLPIQKNQQYLRKVLKYYFVHVLLKPFCVNIYLRGRFFLELMGINIKDFIIKMIRSFPENLLDSITKQPCVALLSMMLKRLNEVKSNSDEMSKIKGDFVSKNLPEEVFVLGKRAKHVNYWLFPVLVQNPEELINCLNKMGVDVYRGVTQLNVIEPSKDNFSMTEKPAFCRNLPQIYFNQMLECGDYPNIPHNKRNLYRQSDLRHMLASQILENYNSAKSSVIPFPKQELLMCEHNNSEMKLHHTTLYQMHSSEDHHCDFCFNLPKHDCIQTWNLMRLNLYPREARFIIDHIIYLPVHKHVPFAKLLNICQIMKAAIEVTSQNRSLKKTLSLKANL